MSRGCIAPTDTSHVLLPLLNVLPHKLCAKFVHWSVPREKIVSGLPPPALHVKARFTQKSVSAIEGRPTDVAVDKIL